MLILFLFVLNILTGLCHEHSWCDPALCGGSKTVQHIACKNDGQFHKRCAPDASDVDISSLKHVFLDEHNKRRNRIASGELPGYYPATRMATLEWDEELQYLAGLNLRTCILDHDDCNHTKRFRNVGQNLSGISRLKSPDVNITLVIEEAVALWFDTEFDEIDSSIVDAFKMTSKFESYGHFAEMIVDRITHVGCGIIRFTHPDYDYLYIYNIACNYSSVYADGAPLYRTGDPAVGCKTGKNPLFLALCSVKEYFDPNY